MVSTDLITLSSMWGSKAEAYWDENSSKVSWLGICWAGLLRPDLLTSAALHDVHLLLGGKGHDV